MTRYPNIHISHLFFSSENNKWVIQTNENHAEGVAELASAFSREFGLPNWGKILGLLHDRGKEKTDFQRFIRINSGLDISAGKYSDKNHSHIGAILIENKYPDSFHLMSNAIAGHHRGLYDHDTLELLLKKHIPCEVNTELPDIAPEKPSMKLLPTDISHLTRMLFSCLTDADYLDTERFMKPEDYISRTNSTELTELKVRLDKWLLRFNAAPDTELNRIRTKINNICYSKSNVPCGFYELSVPTGGGKTISSMVWAINHAISKGKKRIIIAIPYTSIIVQTAEVMREIFGAENVLEHHSVVDENKLSHKNKLAAENWDAPIVVTTNVQLFESIFANSPGKCRKLHSLSNSVVILDEVQNMPLSHLQPIVEALDSYVRLFGLSVLLCTASQPTLTGEHKGLGTTMFHGLTDNIGQIIPSSLHLHEKLRRTTIEMPKALSNMEETAQKISSHNQVLCIVNTRRIALELYKLLPPDESTIHLSRMMCPKHIQETLCHMKTLLKSGEGQTVRVISTQLIEAGVDIDFPIVYRQLAGLDSILQAAGRCNREGLKKEGVTQVFELDNFRAPGLIGYATDAMREMLSLSPDSDWQSPDTMAAYFHILYSKMPSFDKEGIINLTKNPRNIPFETVARKFRLIDESGTPVIINFGDSPNLVNTLHKYGPSKNLTKALGLYSVTIRQHLFNKLHKAGIIEEPWEGFYFIPLKEQYDEKTGLKTDNEYIEQSFII